MASKKVLITGAAGFIGFHLARRLVLEGFEVVGLDNINDYYEVSLKYARLEETGIPIKKEKEETDPYSKSLEYGVLVQSTLYQNYRFVKMDLEDLEEILDLFAKESFDYVVHLAAQAGVRYSLANPRAYVDSNISGMLNILEACQAHPIKHLVYASSSSVYGKNTRMPFSVHHNVDHPVSLYAASKKANELMAHTYSHLFGIPATGLRFFTAYGPWGRPDMALFIFTRAILAKKPIEVYNHGDMMRDFTYIDDIIEGVARVMKKPAQPNPYWNSDQPDPATSTAPHRLYNIGNSNPEPLMDFIDALQEALNKKAIIKLTPIQPGDIPKTWADTTDLVQNLGYKPQTPIRKGIEKFVKWYLEYYGA